MTDEYLWNRNGRPDPDVAELERLLGSFRSETPEPAWPRAPRKSLPASVPLLAAAAVLVLACAATLWRGPARASGSWSVVRLAGSPVAGRAPIGDAARLPIGEWLETDASSRAALAVSTRSTLAPG